MTTDQTNDQTQHDTATNATGSRDLVAGLADAGVSMAFISPGSRNTPLTLALAAEPRIKDVSIRDERSAGFMALGWAKASGTPAVVVCTSGSAATHYFPAIVEADQSATPMIVLTADRPIALRGTSAPQTMDQSDLYGRHVKAFTDIDILGEGLRSTGRRDRRNRSRRHSGTRPSQCPLRRTFDSQQPGRERPGEPDRTAGG